MQKWLRPCSKKTCILLSILAGILAPTSYIPFPPWAMFFAFVPLFWAWLESANNLRRVFFLGWLTQFIFTGIGFYWVAYTVHEFGYMPWPIAIAALLGFCAFANLFVPVAGVAWAWFTRQLNLSEGYSIVTMILFWAVAERLTPMIFDWNLGYVWLSGGLPAYQLADIVGFRGLSTLTLMMNGFVLYGLRRKSWRWLAVTPTMLVILNLWGYWHGKQLPAPDRTARFLVVQANIGNQEKLLAEQGTNYRNAVLERFVNLTKQGLSAHPQTDYVVWPETAFPEVMTDPEMRFGYANALASRVREMNVHLITGGYSQQELTARITNSFFVIDRAGRWLAPPYHKTMLLAFGEYLPGATWFPWLRDQLPMVGDFGRGPGPTAMPADHVRLGPQVCYEGLFDWFTRDLANQNAQVLVNLTNDSWYGITSQPYQHLYMTFARAIEVRRPLVRSTNTGISSVILANGEILQKSPLHQEWFYLYEVPYYSQGIQTAFMTWGYWLFPSLMALTFLFILIKGRRGRTT